MTDNPNDFNQILDSCLDKIFGHGDSIEQCLERHPDYASELEPLLQTALETREALAYTPSSNAKAIAWARFQQAVTSRQAPNRWRHILGILQGFSTRLSGPYRWAATATAAILIIVIGGTGVVTASAGSLPDQPLPGEARCGADTDGFNIQRSVQGPSTRNPCRAADDGTGCHGH